MNKSEQTHVERVVFRAKQCHLGKISADIESRLPGKPEPLTPWDKYKLIKSGVATLKKNLSVSALMTTYRSDAISLVDAYTYPEREEDKAYNTAMKAHEKEKVDREMALENAFNRVANERIVGLIDSKTFLDTVERMQQEVW